MGGVGKRVARALGDYWLAPGGRESLAILRIAIAIATLLSLRQIASTWPQTAPGGTSASTYYPLGLWQLLGGTPPSTTVIEILWFVARIATCVMAVGVGGRAPAIISFIASSSLAALSYSGTPSWSHEYNVVFCAQLAIAFAPVTDAFSVDALWRRKRGVSPPDRGNAYQWAVRLAQFAVALMFASAAFHKLTSGGRFSLDWALSDNLRNQLLVHFDSHGLPRTPVAAWLVDDVWRYRTAALLNIVTQLAPLGACFAVRRPLLRTALGMVFIAETIGLGLVMDLWDIQWLPLIAVFIDWEWLLRRRTPLSVLPARPAPILAFASAFVAVATVVALRARIDRTYHPYPFSSFPMFSSIRARPPYNVHAPYTFEGGHIELVASDQVPLELEATLDRYYTKLFRLRGRSELAAALPGVLRNAQRLHPGTTGVRFYYSVYEAPAYPAPASIIHHPIALLAMIDDDGFHSLLGRAHVEDGTLTLIPGEPGITPSAIESYVDERPEPNPSAFHDWNVSYQKGHDTVFVAVVGNERWVVAQHDASRR